MKTYAFSAKWDMLLIPAPTFVDLAILNANLVHKKMQIFVLVAILKGIWKTLVTVNCVRKRCKAALNAINLIDAYSAQKVIIKMQIKFANLAQL